jgi:hypothetical protein
MRFSGDAASVAHTATYQGVAIEEKAMSSRQQHWRTVGALGVVGGVLLTSCGSASVSAPGSASQQARGYSYGELAAGRVDALPSGPQFVRINLFTLVLYQAIDNRCVKSTYAPGQGFVETPGVVHIARNESASGDVTAQATLLDIAAGTATYKAIVPAPAACPGIK